MLEFGPHKHYWLTNETMKEAYQEVDTAVRWGGAHPLIRRRIRFSNGRLFSGVHRLPLFQEGLHTLVVIVAATSDGLQLVLHVQLFREAVGQ